MTKRSRMILISSILLAACVIATAVFRIVEGKSTSAIVISVVVILVSILSVVFIYRAKIIRGPAEKTLNESYFREYELIREAIMNSPLSPSAKKSVSEDVLELMLTSQSNGKTVQAAIGNAESFAREIISACISKPRSIVAGILDGAIAFILFQLLITTLLWLDDVLTGFFSQRIDTVMILFVAVVSFAVIPATKHLSLKKSAWAYFLPLAAGLVFIGLMELLKLYANRSSLVKALLDGSVSMIPNIASLAALLVVMLILLAVRIKVRKWPKLK